MLLFIFLSSRLWILFDRLGESWGFDSDAHRWMLQILSWKDPIVDVRESFFSYHPPLGFLIPHSLMSIGVSDIVSIQLVSFAASLAAFFFLRATLQKLDLLYHPVSLVFLYLTASIPLQIYMATSINLDAIIVACACATLYCSVRIFWCENTREQRIRLVFGLIAILAFSLLTRFSGLLLLAIPPLVAFFRPTFNFPRLAAATCLGIFALTIASPYYINRYYKTEGVFLPSNNDGWIEPYQAHRDKDRLTFVLNQLFAPLANAEGTALKDFDFAGIRLFDTWNSIWARSTWFRAQNPLSIIVSMIYIASMPILLFGGLIASHKYRHRSPPLWMALGYTLLTFSLLQLLASITFVYDKPYAPWHPAKAIYIAPIVFGIGYLLSNNLYACRSVRAWKAVLGCVALFTIINHTIPVY